MSAAAEASETQRPRLETIYLEHMQFAWRTARYLGVPDRETEDVVHEVFIVVQRRLDDYDPRYSMRSWIAGITRRVVMHHHRKTVRTEKRIEAYEPPLQPAPSPDEIVSAREAAQILQTFLADLDPDRRECFVLGELEGLTAPEIAHVVGRNVNTVYSRLRSARGAFQARIDRLEAVRRREGG